MDHDRLKCWVPLHRATELLHLRSHRKLLHLVQRGQVESRTAEGRRWFWSEEIERLASTRDRERALPRSLPRAPVVSPPGGSPPLPANGLSGEEMNLLSEPVDAGDASAGSVPPPVPDDPEARQLLERLESRLGEFGDRLMTLQRTVEKDAPEVVDAQVIPPLDTDPPVAGPPLRDDDDAPTADLFRRFQAAAAVRDGTTREAGAPSRGLDRSVRRAVLVLVVILASTLAGVLILGLS